MRKHFIKIPRLFVYRWLIILITVMLLCAGTTLYVLAATPIISQPSFETVSNWTYSETDADWTGAQSTAWKTQGSYSYLLSASASNLGNGKYCQILQSVDFTSIDTISFDARLWINSGTGCQARYIVGAATVWSQVVPTTETSYLHQEVDVSGYTGSQDLIFQIITTTAHPSATCTTYFDNIMLLGSFSNSGRTTVSNSYSSTGDIVYMYGETFDLDVQYTLGFFDGAGAKLSDTSFTEAGGDDGIMDTLSIQPSSYPSSTEGTWHAVVYQGSSTPANYASVSKADANYVITDSFTVNASAIPEFPTILSAVVVIGVCSGIFYWLRRRRVAHV